VYTTIHKCQTVEDLEFFLNHEKNVGGEGLIGRKPDGVYKYGRSTPKEQLSIKFKFFEQCEFEVVGFEELHSNTNEQTVNELGYSTRSTHKQNQIPMGILGSLVLEFGDLTFKVGSGFTMEQRSEIWKNQHSYLGKLASVRYMEVGMDKLPRCPSWLGWRDLEDL
jgi:DNA ligase-1